MLYIGPHVSIAKDISLSVERAHALGATGFAIFTKNQKVWHAKDLEEKSIKAFRENLQRCSIPLKAILPHAGYLINMATPKEELREKSMALMLDEGKRVNQLGIDLLNIHPGAYIEGERIDGIKRTAAFLDEALDQLPGTLRIALENTAGAGTVLGDRLEELQSIIEYSRHKDQIGITIDTMHIFGAGYDVRNNMTGVMDEVMERFGKEKLYGMHLNDSMVELGSHKDRHDSIGIGKIGLEAFMELASRSDIEEKPLILETPNEERWPYEIGTLLKCNQEKGC